jgi:predicted Zn-dependent protease
LRFPRRASGFAAAAVLAGLAAACASAPAAPRRSQSPAAGTLPGEAPSAQAGELARGRELAAALFARDPLIGDQRLLRYVNLVGRAAAAEIAGRDRFRFAVTTSGVPYTLALPGGFVVLSRGALALMNSEAELAVGLAREVCREQSVGATASGPEIGSGEGALEARWDACGARLASSAGYDAGAYLHYLSVLENRADSARQRLDLQQRMDQFKKLPEFSKGGRMLEDRFRRSAMS